MKIITDTDEYNLLNIKIIDSDMKTIYIEEKSKGFIILISNKIIESKDIDNLLGFKVIINDDESSIILLGLDLKLSLNIVTRLNVNSKLMFIEETTDDKYRLTFSSKFISNIEDCEIELNNFKLLLEEIDKDYGFGPNEEISDYYKVDEYISNFINYCKKIKVYDVYMTK